MLKYNPKWTGADWAGEIPFIPKWATGQFTLCAMFVFDAAIPFTRESWRGRVRACRGVGATLAPEQIEAFDREHEKLLKNIAPDLYTRSHIESTRICFNCRRGHMTARISLILRKTRGYRRTYSLGGGVGPP